MKCEHCETLLQDDTDADALARVFAHALAPHRERWPDHTPERCRDVLRAQRDTLSHALEGILDTAHHCGLNNIAERARAALAASALPDDKESAFNVDRLSLPDDLRAGGWTVAVHNDYRLNGEPHTFWLFTKDGLAVKGEGRTDADALRQVRAVVATHNALAKSAAPSEETSKC